RERPKNLVTLSAYQFLPQHRGVAGEGQSGFEIDDAVAHQLGDFAVEVLHTLASSRFHGIEQGFALALTLFHALSRARICFQDFGDRDSSAAIGFRKQALADDVAESLGKALP